MGDRAGQVPPVADALDIHAAIVQRIQFQFVETGSLEALARKRPSRVRERVPVWTAGGASCGHLQRRATERTRPLKPPPAA